mgnify:CR=1 FL=1
MSIGILGTKIGMTQIFDSKGCAIPITVIQAGPCIVTHIKTNSKDGYQAVQIGYSQTHATKLTKAQLGHLKTSNAPALRYLHEYKINSKTNYKLGDVITVNKLKIGQLVNISGKSIGKGFSGYQKRHKFSRGPMTHGSKNHRKPGSIGPGTTPGRVFPGKKMAGRLGGKVITIKQLQIIDINPELHLIAIKGSVPGPKGSLLSLKTQY